jgi:hypothetical protein
MWKNAFLTEGLDMFRLSLKFVDPDKIFSLRAPVFNIVKLTVTLLYFIFCDLEQVAAHS